MTTRTLDGQRPPISLFVRGRRADDGGGSLASLSGFGQWSVGGGGGTARSARALSLYYSRTHTHACARPIRSIISANIPAVVLLAARRVLLLLARRRRRCRRLRRRAAVVIVVVESVRARKSKTTGETYESKN